MKKILPFVFPITSLLIVAFLVFRWYNQRTERGSITPFAENTKVEELTEQDELDTLKGVGDFQTVDLQAAATAPKGVESQLRYEVKDGKVRFAVSMNVAEGDYEVWLKDPGSNAVKRAFALEIKKGGLMGSAAISTDSLPVEILVVERGKDALTQAVFSGMLDEDVSYQLDVEAISE